jgi:hypothetical protein
MSANFTADLAAVIASALGGGIETTIEDLGKLLEVDGDVLTVATAVSEFVEMFPFEFEPPMTDGEISTTRVLRPTVVQSGVKLRVAEFAADGEGPTVEFKSSLMCSMRQWAKDQTLVEIAALPGEVLKTICAFLNSDGGHLLIGIDDNGNPCGGIERDLDLKGWDFDRWQLHFASLLKERFHDGGTVLPYVQLQTCDIEGARIVLISVLPRAQRSFVKRDKDKAFEFFARNGSRTENLTLPDFYAHLLARPGY